MSESGIEQALAVGRVDDDLVCFDGDVAVVLPLRQLAAFEELKTEAAQADLLAGLDQHLATDADAIDVGSVTGAQVLGQDAFRRARQARVTPGDHGKLQGHVALRVAADLHGVAAKADFMEGSLADLHLLLVGEQLRGGNLVGSQVHIRCGIENSSLDSIAQLPNRGSVGGVPVLNDVLAIFLGDDGVVPADFRQVDLHVGLRRPADGDGPRAGRAPRQGRQRGRSRAGGRGIRRHRPGHLYTAAQGHLRPMRNPNRVAGRNFDSVDEGAVGRAQILKRESIALVRQTAVVARDSRLRHLQVAVVRAPDHP